VTAVSLDLELDPLGGRARPLSSWLTTFPLLPVLLDPYTNESAWILHTARRILVTYAEAGCRTCWVVACDPDDARRFLGPYARRDPHLLRPRPPGAHRARARHLARVRLRPPERVGHRGRQGWNPAEWRDVAETVSDYTHWQRPVIGDGQDPVAFPGTPARP